VAAPPGSSPGRTRRDQAAEEAARRAAEAAAWLAKKAEWHRLAPKVGLQGSDLLDAQENQNDSETWLIDTYGARRQLASQVSCRRSRSGCPGRS